MVVESFVDVIDLGFDPQENLLVLRMLLGVPLVKPAESPHHGAANKGDDNRNPPHVRSHPPLSYGFSLDSSVSGLLLLKTLTFPDGRAVEVLFAVGKTQTNAFDVASKTNLATTWDNIHNLGFSTFFA
jgi:hypothetical protein